MIERRRKRVLVVDDNRDAADTLAMLLEAEGCDCATAYDGDQALALAARLQPDLAIIDLFMPGMRGDELARLLRASDEHDAMVLVAHTAMSSHLHHDTIAEAGFDYHLVKPAMPDDLLALIDDRHDALHHLQAPGWRPGHVGHSFRPA
jgi:CheY-like chemotaxis protein